MEKGLKYSYSSFKSQVSIGFVLEEEKEEPECVCGICTAAFSFGRSLSRALDSSVVSNKWREGMTFLVS